MTTVSCKSAKSSFFSNGGQSLSTDEGYRGDFHPGDLPAPLASKGEALLCTKNLTTTEATEEGTGAQWSEGAHTGS